MDGAYHREDGCGIGPGADFELGECLRDARGAVCRICRANEHGLETFRPEAVVRPGRIGDAVAVEDLLRNDLGHLALVDCDPGRTAVRCECERLSVTARLTGRYGWATWGAVRDQGGLR